MCVKNTLRFQNKRCDHANSQLLPGSAQRVHIFSLSPRHIISPAANILPRQAEMTFSYSSPTFTQTLLGGDAGRGSPRSPRLSFRASVHACKELDDVDQITPLRSCLTGSHIPSSAVCLVTIVCTAAFAAISTAFVCIFVLTSRQNEDEGHHMPLHFSHERGNDNSVSLRSKGGPKRPEFPVEESIGMADVDSSFVKLGRRSILPRTQRDAAKIVVNDPSTWPTAAVWLMVSAGFADTSALSPRSRSPTAYPPKTVISELRHELYPPHRSRTHQHNDCDELWPRRRHQRRRQRTRLQGRHRRERSIPRTHSRQNHNYPGAHPHKDSLRWIFIFAQS